MPFADVLIIGTGIAGLSAGIKLARKFPHHRICIVTKRTLSDSNTHYAQGGVSVVLDLSSDTIDSHVEDTLKAGDGLCNEETVQFVVENAYDRLKELVSYGVNFDRDEQGRFSLALEGGHRHRRIVHCKDSTGASISSVLISTLKKLSNVTLLTNHTAIDLITTSTSSLDPSLTTRCQGVIVVDNHNNKVSNYFSRVTILATGGIGQLYAVTTNPLIATGDGIAMALRAGASVSNMEFIQFHPTALASFDTNPVFLISEAVRGHGARLINQSGERFMSRYHPDGELACRDIVARAIAKEGSGGQEIFLDCAPIASDFAEKFPGIYQKCMSLGLDPTYAPLPVTPAAHFLCGGIDVDLHARTTIENLYACGECANTGLHGANRLASNSLLEGMVFAHTCYQHIAQRLNDVGIETQKSKSIQLYPGDHQLSIQQTRTALRKLMTERVGIIRTSDSLSIAKQSLLQMRETIIGSEIVTLSHLELQNMVDVAILIAEQALQRNRNYGAHYNADHVNEKMVV